MTSQNFHEDFTHYKNSIEASSRILRCLCNSCIYSHCIHIACWVSFLCPSVYWRHVSTKRRLIWIIPYIVALWLFKIGVVYLSPKPHQIRMAMQHLKHSMLASVGVIKGTRSKIDLVSACVLYVTCPWRCELGVWCKRPMGKWLLLQLCYKCILF